jgi:hypothetical protein
MKFTNRLDKLQKEKSEAVFAMFLRGIVMKKLIVLIVLVILVFVILKIMGIQFSASSSPDEQKEQVGKGEFLTNDYKFWTYEDILGFSLPKRASEIHHTKYISSYMKLSDIFRDNSSTDYVYSTDSVVCGVVADLPREDFEVLVDNQGLQKEPDLLATRPDILQLDEFFSFANWDINNRNINNVYFKESPDYEEYTACTYKDGKIYIKKETTYSQYRGENNKCYYEKAKKRAGD